MQATFRGLGYPSVCSDIEHELDDAPGGGALMARSRDDIRLSAGFRSHPKVLRLHRELGNDGVLALVTLWAWVAVDGRHDGNLAGLSDEEIEDAALWSGPPGAFVRAASARRLLDGAAGERRIHDWAEEQPWRSSAPSRSVQASEAGSKGGKASVEVRRARYGSAQPRMSRGSRVVEAPEAVASGSPKRSRSDRFGGDVEAASKRSRSDPEATASAHRSDSEAVASTSRSDSEAPLPSPHEVNPLTPFEAELPFEAPPALRREFRARRASAHEVHVRPPGPSQPAPARSPAERAQEVANFVVARLAETDELPGNLTAESRRKLAPYVPPNFRDLEEAERSRVLRTVYDAVRSALVGDPMPALPESPPGARSSPPQNQSLDEGMRRNGRPVAAAVPAPPAPLQGARQ